MAPFGPALLVVAALGMVLTPLPAAAHTVEVSGARVRLGDLLAGVAEPFASLDMGASPEPNQQARYIKDDIKARVAMARLVLPQKIVLPRVVQVVRRAQTLDEPHLTRLVRQSLITHLPAGSRINSLRIDGGLSLPEGVVDIQPELPDSLGSGAHLVRLSVSASAPNARRSAATYVQAYVDIDVIKSPQGVPVLARGSEVIVQVRSKGVLVQTSGLAQQAGGVGDLIRVLPNLSSRTLQARIVDGRTVEVQL